MEGVVGSFLCFVVVGFFLLCILLVVGSCVVWLGC